MNKKGEKLLSVWWFFILIIVGAGIVIGVLIYNAKPTDVREIEADILAERVADCLYGKSYEELSKIDIYKECMIKKEVIQEQDFYLEVALEDAVGNAIQLAEYSKIEGVSCAISNQAEAEEYPRCSEKSFDLNGEKQGKINILVSSNQKQ